MKVLLLITASTISICAQTVRLKPIHVVADKNKTDFAVKTIKKNVADTYVVDVLSKESDLNIVRDGGVAGRASLFLRGGNSDHVAVIFDAVDVRNAVDVSPNFSNIYNGDEKITVVKGPVSAKYGADAIMGAVTFSTPDPVRQDYHAVNLQAGKSWYQKTAYVYEHAQDDTGVRVHLNQQSTRGTVSKPRDQRRTVADGRSEKKSQQDGNATLTHKINDKWHFKTHLKRDQSATQYLADFPTSHTMESHDQTNVANITFENTDSAFWKPTFSLNHQQYQRVDHDLHESIKNRMKKDSVVTDMIVENAFDFKDFRIHMNLSSREEVLYQMNPPIHHINRQSMASGVEYDWGQGATSNIWYRLNRTNRGHQSHDFSTEHQVSFDKITLFGMLGIAHRAPSLIQLYDERWGNPQLKSEENTGTSMGYSYDFEVLTLKQTYFQNYLRNMIVGDPTCSWRNMNISRAKTEGLESEISLPISDVLTYTLAHTYLFTKDLAKNIMLARRPTHKIVQQLFFKGEDWRWGIGVITIGKQLDYDPAIYKNRYRGGYSTMNLTSEYQLTPKALAFGKIENLLSRNYQSPLGYDQPRFSFIVGLKVQLS